MIYLMDSYFVNWTRLSEKELQKLISTFISNIDTISTEIRQQQLDFIWQIVKSEDCCAKMKLRFGSLIFCGIIKFNYPCTIGEVLRKTREELEICVSLLNGMIDYRGTYRTTSLSLSLLTSLMDENSKFIYHLTMMTKKLWSNLEKEICADDGEIVEFETMKRIIRYFVPHLNSNVPGVSLLVVDFFIAVLQWSSRFSRSILLANQLQSLLSNDIFSEFFCPNNDWQKLSSYQLLRTNLRFLRTIISGMGIGFVLKRLPLVFKFFIEALSLNYTAPAAKDCFICTVKPLQHLPNETESIQQLFQSINEFLESDLSVTHFDGGNADLRMMKLCNYILPILSEYRPQELIVLLNQLMVRLPNANEQILMAWMAAFAVLHKHRNLITEIEIELIEKCLWNSNDFIRMTAYRFVSENFSSSIFRNSSTIIATISLSEILDVLVNNLTSDNPSFRNHLISSTKILFRGIRDSVVVILSNTDELKSDIHFAVTQVGLETNTASMGYLESFCWKDFAKLLENLKHKDIALLIAFCRFIFCKSWFSCSINYQRQRCLIELIKIIFDVFVDSTFFIDKTCGFSDKTILAIRQFYNGFSNDYFGTPEFRINMFLQSILQTKADVQTDLYQLVIQTKQQHGLLDPSVIDYVGLFVEAVQLCNSYQPSLNSAGSYILSFLHNCNYLIPPTCQITILEYLMTFIRELSRMKPDNVIETVYKRPGHGLLSALNVVLQSNENSDDNDCGDCIAMTSGLVDDASNIIELVMKIMGCENDGLASFQKIGISITSLVSNESEKGNKPVDVTLQFQHVLSWAWQTLKLMATILVSWCKANLNKGVNSKEFKKVGLLLMGIMSRSRHRGTIECVGQCLQQYLQLAVGSGYGEWLTPSEVALSQCSINDSRYSVTRRSAGLPLVLMAGLISSTHSGGDLVGRCLCMLLDLSTANDDECWLEGRDLPIIHQLNLIRHMVREPILINRLFPFYGKITLVSLSQFQSTNWGIRNAALQLFTTIMSRIASVTQGLQTNSSFADLLSIYPELWQPVLIIVRQRTTTYMHNHILIPTLTLLSCLCWSHDNHLPEGMRLVDLQNALWHLLGNPVSTVRRLASKCIVQCIPTDNSSFDTVAKGTVLLPLLYGQSPIDTTNICLIPTNQQHGELYLLKLLLSHHKLSLDKLSYGNNLVLNIVESFLSTKQCCWLIVEAAVNVLLVVPSSFSECLIKITQQISELFLFAIRSLPSNSIGKIDACSSILRFLLRQPISTQLLSSIFYRDQSSSNILQQLCSIHTDRYPIPIHNSINIILLAIQDSLINYSPNYTPYLLQFCYTFLPSNYPVITNHHIDLVPLLTKNPLLPETVRLSVLQITTWLYLHCPSSCSADDLINYLIVGLHPNLPEQSRMVCIRCLSTLLTCNKNDYSIDKIIQNSPLSLISEIIVCCFDECIDIRLVARVIVTTIVGCDKNQYFKCHHVLDFLDIISSTKNCSIVEICLSVWRDFVLHQINFYHEMQSGKLREVLYEPMPSNIYVEYGLLFELLWSKVNRSNCQVESISYDIKSLLAMHPNNLNDDNVRHESAASILFVSKQFLVTLQEHQNKRLEH